MGCFFFPKQSILGVCAGRCSSWLDLIVCLSKGFDRTLLTALGFEHILAGANPRPPCKPYWQPLGSELPTFHVALPFYGQVPTKYYTILKNCSLFLLSAFLTLEIPMSVFSFPTSCRLFTPSLLRTLPFPATLCPTQPTMFIIIFLELSYQMFFLLETV